jgi:hypothetical protein
MDGRVSDPHERLRILQDNAAPMKRTPGLRTVNMLGNVPGGMIKDAELGGAYLRSVWFMFFGIPFSMVGIFLVSHPLDKKGLVEMDKFFFHQKVTFRGVDAAYGKGAVGRIVRASALQYAGTLLGIVIVIGLLVAGGAYCSQQQ